MKKLDGYSLVIDMRKIRTRNRLGAVGQALYHELIAICNGDKWPEVFRVCNEELFLALRISEKTLINARKKLVESKLLYYKSGKSKKVMGTYSFITPLQVPARKKRNASTQTAANPAVQTATESTAQTAAQPTDSYKPETETKNLSNESQKRSIPEDTPPAPAPEYVIFQEWLAKQAPFCANSRHFPKQITEEGFFRLKAKYTGKQIADVILQLENRKDLRKRYVDLYRTVLNWAKREYGK